MKKNWIIVCIGVLFVSTAWGQEERTAAKKRPVVAADQALETDARQWSHSELLDSARVFQETNIEKSIDYVARSLTQLGRAASQDEQASSFALLGDVYKYHGQYDLAIANYTNALRSSEDLNVLLSLGRTYLITGDYEQARTNFLRGLEMGSRVPYRQIQLYEGLGDAYKAEGNKSAALEAYEKGLALAVQNNITPKQADLNSRKADLYADYNEPAKAEELYDSSLQLASEESPQRSVREKEKVADFYNKNQNFDEEIKLRKESLDDIKQLPPSAQNEAGVPMDAQVSSQAINYKIANAYIAQEKDAEAIPFLEESIETAESEDDLEIQKDATRKLSEVYGRQGEFTKALETYQTYVAVVDTLYKRKEEEIASAQRLTSQILAQQGRITGLEQERELSMSKYDLAVTQQQLVEETNKRQQWLIYSLLFGLILMALAAFFFYRANRQQQFANNLLALRSLRTQMNPHFIFNALNSVNNYIAKNDERSANKYLSDFSALMRSVLENSEEDFIPLQKEIELLKLYLELEHSRFPDKFDYKVDIDPKIDIESFQIPPMLLQPYIENAIWHGLRYKEEKGYLKVQMINLDSANIEIRIEDNGIGRKRSVALKTEHQNKKISKGMSTTKKRVAILNKMYDDKVDISIDDLKKDETGTVVVLRIKKDR
ncbi:MAG: tetratricopeptide repeat protein [Bacteroidia bacterium]|nr:tetratricopeptide repeat protein [Bacteroidia bacterium]